MSFAHDKKEGNKQLVGQNTASNSSVLVPKKIIVPNILTSLHKKVFVRHVQVTESEEVIQKVQTKLQGIITRASAENREALKILLESHRIHFIEYVAKKIQRKSSDNENQLDEKATEALDNFYTEITQCKDSKKIIHLIDNILLKIELYDAYLLSEIEHENNHHESIQQNEETKSARRTLIHDLEKQKKTSLIPQRDVIIDQLIHLAYGKEPNTVLLAFFMDTKNDANIKKRIKPGKNAADIYEEYLKEIKNFNEQIKKFDETAKLAIVVTENIYSNESTKKYVKEFPELSKFIRTIVSKSKHLLYRYLSNNTNQKTLIKHLYKLWDSSAIATIDGFYDSLSSVFSAIFREDPRIAKLAKNIYGEAWFNIITSKLDKIGRLNLARVFEKNYQKAKNVLIEKLREKATIEISGKSDQSLIRTVGNALFSKDEMRNLLFEWGLFIVEDTDIDRVFAENQYEWLVELVSLKIKQEKSVDLQQGCREFLKSISNKEKILAELQKYSTHEEALEYLKLIAPIQIREYLEASIKVNTDLKPVLDRARTVPSRKNDSTDFTHMDALRQLSRRRRTAPTKLEESKSSGDASSSQQEESVENKLATVTTPEFDEITLPDLLDKAAAVFNTVRTRGVITPLKDPTDCANLLDHIKSQIHIHEQLKYPDESPYQCRRMEISLKDSDEKIKVMYVKTDHDKFDEIKSDANRFWIMNQRIKAESLAISKLSILGGVINALTSHQKFGNNHDAIAMNLKKLVEVDVFNGEVGLESFINKIAVAIKNSHVSFANDNKDEIIDFIFKAQKYFVAEINGNRCLIAESIERGQPTSLQVNVPFNNVLTLAQKNEFAKIYSEDPPIWFQDMELWEKRWLKKYIPERWEEFEKLFQSSAMQNIPGIKNARVNFLVEKKVDKNQKNSYKIRSKSHKSSTFCPYEIRKPFRNPRTQMTALEEVTRMTCEQVLDRLVMQATLNFKKTWGATWNTIPLKPIVYIQSLLTNSTVFDRELVAIQEEQITELAKQKKYQGVTIIQGYDAINSARMITADFTHHHELLINYAKKFLALNSNITKKQKFFINEAITCLSEIGGTILGRNKSLYKSAYCGLLVQAMDGATSANCMSGKDRTGDDEAYKIAMMKYFRRYGRLPRYNDKDVGPTNIKTNHYTSYVKEVVKIIETRIIQESAATNTPGSFGIKDNWISGMLCDAVKDKLGATHQLNHELASFNKPGVFRNAEARARSRRSRKDKAARKGEHHIVGQRRRGALFVERRRSVVSEHYNAHLNLLAHPQQKLRSIPHPLMANATDSSLTSISEESLVPEKKEDSQEEKSPALTSTPVTRESLGLPKKQETYTSFRDSQPAKPNKGFFSSLRNVFRKSATENVVVDDSATLGVLYQQYLASNQDSFAILKFYQDMAREFINFEKPSKVLLQEIKRINSELLHHLIDLLSTPEKIVNHCMENINDLEESIRMLDQVTTLIVLAYDDRSKINWLHKRDEFKNNKNSIINSKNELEKVRTVIAEFQKVIADDSYDLNQIKAKIDLLTNANIKKLLHSYLVRITSLTVDSSHATTVIGPSSRGRYTPRKFTPAVPRVPVDINFHVDNVSSKRKISRSEIPLADAESMMKNLMTKSDPLIKNQNTHALTVVYDRRTNTQKSSFTESLKKDNSYEIVARTQSDQLDLRKMVMKVLSNNTDETLIAAITKEFKKYELSIALKFNLEGLRLTTEEALDENDEESLVKMMTANRLIKKKIDVPDIVEKLINVYNNAVSPSKGASGSLPPMDCLIDAAYQYQAFRNQYINEKDIPAPTIELSSDPQLVKAWILIVDSYSYLRGKKSPQDFKENKINNSGLTFGKDLSHESYLTMLQDVCKELKLEVNPKIEPGILTNHLGFDAKFSG